MYWKFDADKFSKQQLPPLLRTKGIYALIKCFMTGIAWIQKKLVSYRSDVIGKLSGNGFTANLEKLLNDKLALEPGTIYIADDKSDNTYLHYYEEVAENVYVGFVNEEAQLYLSSDDPSDLSGGFAVMVPADLATEENLTTLRKWVDYYKYAGTMYKIKTYE